MRQRKIDDDKLLKLLREGKNQKEAAAILGVSEPAVCKRLKRLTPPPETPNFDKLTDKEKKYVIERIKGSTQTQSALKAYECGSMESAKVIGSQLEKKPEIEMSISELMDHCGINKAYRIRRLKQIIDSKDLNIAHKGLDMSFKLDGSYAPEKSEHFFSFSNLIRSAHKKNNTIDSDEDLRPEGPGIVEVELIKDEDN